MELEDLILYLQRCKKGQHGATLTYGEVVKLLECIEELQFKYDKEVYTRCPCCKKELLVILTINDSFANAEIKQIKDLSRNEIK